MLTGTLFLLPVGLGMVQWESYLPPAVRSQALALDYFIVENAKSARACLKSLGMARPLQDIEIREIPSSASEAALQALLQPLTTGRCAGIMSEAGCPGVADPGAALVRTAHHLGLPVRPMVGPSSILLALMASGLEGQRFAFHGYLPVKDDLRRAHIQQLERESRKHRQTQIFIETPYRNRVLFQALVEACHDSTLLCVATNLTLSDETIGTRTAAAWRKRGAPEMDKRPTVFLMLSE